MATTFRSVWQGAAFRADLSVNGAGPHASERVSDSEWRLLLNEAVMSAWRLAASARPDFQVTSQDVTIVSGGSASIPMAAWFFDLIDVVYGPDTAAEYSLGPFAWQNRRSPGGWFAPNFMGNTNVGGNVARPMGSNIYIEPSLRAGGTYRVWFCPMPKTIRADATVRLATTAPLPTCVAAGGPGLGKTLTGSFNGALSIDGNPVNAGDTVLVANQVNAVNNGLYFVVQPGDGGTPFILTRQIVTVLTGNLGFMVYVSAGATNVDLFFETVNPATTTVDVTAWTWTEAFIEPALEQFSELLKLLTAIPAMQRDDDLDPKPLMLRAFGDGSPTNPGLVGELKSYFGRTRTANTPSKMVDTDARGPRSPWGF